tara:strand:- start:6741 stop:8252 length:1512 start_codon:yes stop_codon:yes gene_type:complete
MNTYSFKNISLAFVLSGLLLMVLSIFEILIGSAQIYFYASFGLMTFGSLLYFWAQYANSLPGIKNNGIWFHPLTARGLWGWLLGISLTLFYIFLYWFPEILGYNPSGSSGIVAFFDPLSIALNGKPATQWFLYGSLYTFAIVLFGIKFIWKYRHSNYHILRTLSAIFFQLFFAYLIPEILSALHPEMPNFSKDLKNMWPLQYYFFEEWHLSNMLQGGFIGTFFLCFGLLLIFVISPLLTYFYGKRWYCSWVCGCGALAETAGDPFRQLSSKKISVWKLERWMIHVVLVFAIITTIAALWSFMTQHPEAFLFSRHQFLIGVILLGLILLTILGISFRKEFDKNTQYALLSVGIILIVALTIPLLSTPEELFFVSHDILQQWYGFSIGATFSGVLGVGFYPIFGSRVWCRFGCPMAAILGLQQRLFSRFRITTNGGQCISCGNCSSYCEMGIDVRAYAQKSQNIIRSSCVGCGICATVCPRGVLKLENGPLHNRMPLESDDLIRG